MVNSTFVVDRWCSFLCDGKDQCCFEPEKYYHVELKFTPAQPNLPTAYDNFSWKCAPSRRGNVFFSNDAQFSCVFEEKKMKTVQRGKLKSYFLKSRDLANAFISHLALSTMILLPKGITTLFQHILWFLYCKCSRVLLVSSTCIWTSLLAKILKQRLSCLFHIIQFCTRFDMSFFLLCRFSNWLWNVKYIGRKCSTSQRNRSKYFDIAGWSFVSSCTMRLEIQFKALVLC